MSDAGREKGVAAKLRGMRPQIDEALGSSFLSRQALQSFLKFLHQYSVFSCSRRFPPIRSPFSGQAILGIKQPIAPLARGTPRQSQSRRLASVGSKQPGPRSETLQCARQIPIVRLVPSGARLPRSEEHTSEL